jgi:hypothetical protein
MRAAIAVAFVTASAIVHATPPPPSFCELHADRCHAITPAERKRFEQMATALTKAVTSVAGYSRTQHTRDRFWDLGVGTAGASWWDFAVYVVEQPPGAKPDYVHDTGVSVSLTPLPIAGAYHPGGRVTMNARDQVTIEYPGREDGTRITWIIVGEIAGEGNPAVVPEQVAPGPLNDVRAVLVAIVGRRSDVQNIVDTLDLAQVRKVVREY